MDKQKEWRYRFAGMAMQAYIQVICDEPKKILSVLEACKQYDYNNLHEYIARAAVMCADELIKKLNDESNGGNTES